MNLKGFTNFSISERKVLLKFLDLAFIYFVLILINFIFNFRYFEDSTNELKSILLLVFYVLLFGSIFNLYNLHDSISFLKTLKNTFFSSVSIVVAYLSTPIISPMLPQNRIQIIFFFCAINLGYLISRLIYISFFSNYNFNKQIFLICIKNDYEGLKNELENATPHIKVSNYYYLDEAPTNELDNNNIGKLKALIHENKTIEIVVACPDSSNITIELNNVLLKLIERGYSVKQYTNVFEDLTYRIPVHLVEKDFYKYFPFSRNNNNKLYIFINRSFDIIFSLIGLLLFLPIFFIILLINIFWNKGPTFYTQKRIGKFGKAFKIYKLRSMIINAEKNGPVFAEKNDHRITSFGKLLRKSRLDEIPQLFNVLKNEMSIIGPRPERPEFVKELNKIMPFYETRHMTKPGLTGWAQINYNYGSSFEDSLIKLQYDLYYIKNRNIFIDLNIVLKTLKTVILLKGQ
jgi:exopolysaccharide biosynthesis polyprenyl glycosylphosphotransferase